ncbi:ATP-binding protein [Streptomyces sp. NPDC002738]
MNRDDGRPGQDLGNRLRAARRDHFVGRVTERSLFRAAIERDPGAFVVLYLYGPGGIGKSALLDRLADDAEEADRPVVRVDGRTVGPSPHEFKAQADAAITTNGAVLLVDNFEQCQELDSWLRHEFLPRLSDDALVIMSSCLRPETGWRSDPGWSDALRVVALRNLPPDESIALLKARGVRDELHDSILAFAGGNPLALSLAAEVAKGEDAGTTSWAPSQDVIETLLSQLVGAVPSPAHRHALEICAHARTTTEELLRAILPQDAAALFGWLRSLPIIESGPRGVFPHDVVRAALDADLRWRDPQSYEAMHRKIRSHILDRARNAEGPAMLHAMGALTYVHRHGRLMPSFTWQGENEVEEWEFQPADRDRILKIAEKAEGAESARIADFWINRQPAAFRVYRETRTGELIGFMAWLRLGEPQEDENAADPVVARAWEHCRSACPIRSGEHVGLARFMVTAVSYGRPSPTFDLMQMRILSEWLHRTHLACSFLVPPDAAFWESYMDHVDHQRVPHTAVVDGRNWVLFAHDWRAVPADVWLDRCVAQELYGTEFQPAQSTIELVVLSRPEFDDAVRSALRAWCHPGTLSTSPLIRSRLIADNGGADPVESLRQLLIDATDALADDPHVGHLHRVVATTYFHQVLTQEAAAERLGLPFSTYRRHLAKGVDRITDWLWEREVHGVNSD